MTADQVSQMEESYDTLIDNMRENLELNTEQIYLAFKESRGDGCRKPRRERGRNDHNPGRVSEDVFE